MAANTTDPEREKRALAEVERLIELEGDARASALAELRAADPELAARIEQLMQRDPDAHGWMPTEGTGLWEAEDGRAPDRIGPFRITGVLGRGGMGVVLRGERDDGLFDQVVAIKLMRSGLVSLRLQERFILERKILARLDSPSVSRILDGGVWEGRPFLIMDFVDGEAVTKHAASNAIDLRARLALFLKICGVVQYAHRQLIVHADLKPSNIMITPEGEVKLLDFGIARLIGDEIEAEEVEAGSGSSGSSGRGSITLTRAYAAPERRRGERPTIAGDVFNLGAILFELLAGLLPDQPEADNPQAAPPPWPLASSHATGPIAPEQLHGDLDAIVAKAVSTLPEERYADVGLLTADIQRWLDHYPVSARPLAWRGRTQRFIARHQRGLALSAAVGVLLVSAAAFSTYEASRAERARAEATARFGDARGAANYLMFDVMDRLQDQPNSLKLRSEIAIVAQRYLDRLASSPDAPKDIRMDVATGLWRLANAQGVGGHPNLGQPEAANRNLERAERLAEALDGQEALVLLAHIRLDRAVVAMDLQFEPARAAQLLESAAASVARAKPFDRQLPARLQLVRAALFNWQGDYPQAQKTAREALAMLPAGEQPDAIVTRALAADILAEAIYYSAGASEAEPVYRDQLATLGAAGRRFADNNYLRYWLGRSQWNLATTLAAQGKLGEALPMIAAADRNTAAALAFDPDDAAMQIARRVTRTAYAQLLSANGQADAGLAQLEGVLADDRARMAAAPRDPRPLRDTAYDLATISEALAGLGRAADACFKGQESLARYREAKQRGVMTAFDQANNIKLLTERLKQICPSL